ncbi:HNH endonuclease [Cobetia sp. QF-1]|uniref:HNH endonuclease n=1 Tax=Cobetia sp. QF-1 TaxID=1969833 RepID=UPI000B543787|nr:HNH endonuclease [Cobetia sp. QF-1]
MDSFDVKGGEGMLNCIYCPDEFFVQGKGSKEHAILSSIGGRKISRNICCVKCNARLGNEIDEHVSEGLKFLSTLCGITTGRGRPAAAINNAGCHNDLPFSLKSGGEIVVSQSKISVCSESETINISIQAKDIGSAEKLFSHQLKRFGKKEEEISNYQVTTHKEYIKPVEMSVSMESGEHKRSVAKMALTYTATLISPDRLRSGIFYDIIDYINNGSGKISLVYFYPNSTPGNVELPVTSHKVVIIASSEKKKAVGFIELFGGIRFIILLSDSWNGGDIYKVHVVDGRSGKQSNYCFSKDKVNSNVFAEMSEISEEDICIMFNSVISCALIKQVEITEDKIIRDETERFKL